MEATPVERSRTVSRFVAHEADELRARLPGVDLQVLPLRGGGFESELITLDLGGISLQIGRSDACVAFAGVQHGAAVLQFPLRNISSLLLNGRQCRQRMFCAYGEGAEMMRVNPRPSSYAALFLSGELREFLLEPPLRLGLFRPRSDILLRARPGDWKRWSTLVTDAAKTAATTPEVLCAMEPRRALREEVLAVISNLIDSADQEPAPARPKSVARRRRLIAAVDGYLRAHIDQPVYTEDLCRALGTSSSALAEAFRATLGISPHRFLKLRRLHMVRDALRNLSGPTPLVKAVALSHGFWHLGQFAGDYRAQFGEAPSETVLRAHVGGSVETNGAVLLALAG